MRQNFPMRVIPQGESDSVIPQGARISVIPQRAALSGPAVVARVAGRRSGIAPCHEVRLRQSHSLVRLPVDGIADARRCNADATQIFPCATELPRTREASRGRSKREMRLGLQGLDSVRRDLSEACICVASGR